MADQSLSAVGFAGTPPTSVAVSPLPAASNVADPATAQEKLASRMQETGVIRNAAVMANGPVAATANGSQTDLAGARTAAGGAATGADPVDAAVKKANQSLSASGTQLVFVFDDRSHSSVVKLLDIQTQKVVQEIPAGAMPGTANALSGDSSSGALIDTIA